MHGFGIWVWSGKIVAMVTFAAIQSAAREIAERFKPERIILFGSYAYGKPNEHSDVDYMVLFNGRKVSDRDLDIRAVIKFDFPVDLLVRSRAEFERRIALEDFFLREINDKGVVLYEAADQGVGEKSGRRLHQRRTRVSRAKVAKF
jgi:uncharacterized protein